MPPHFFTILLYTLNACLNLAGVLLLKQAVARAMPWQAVLGGMCWLGTACIFVLLLDQKGSNLAVVSVTTSALGFLAVIAVSTILHKEIPTTPQMVGIGLMVAGLMCVALSDVFWG